MSSSSSTFIIGIGPSGSSQATIQLTTPTPSTFSTTSDSTSYPDITPSSDMSTISSVGHPSATSSSTPSVASRTPNLGAIIGGTLGGITALLWLLLLLWWANRHSWFHRPGYKRHSDPDTERTYEKPKPIVPTSEFARPPQPPAGIIGARTFGQPQPVHLPSRMSFGDPPRQSYGDPPRTNFEKTSFGDLPRPNFGSAPPVPTRPNPPPTARSLSGFGIGDRGSTFERPMSSFGDRSGFGDRDRERDRPRSGFGELDRPRSIFGELDRPRSGFGDRPRSGFGDSRRSLSPDRVRRFFTGQNKQDEWAGAGRRISMEPASLEMEDRGVLGFFARVKESAARRKRVKAEYEEDMRRMRGRSVGDSDFGRF